MTRMKILRGIVGNTLRCDARAFACSVAAASLLLLPALAWTQTGTSGSITGVVRDTSGAVLPGVTVEAASPALIERVRTAVSDGGGVYRIVDLRPGTYSVTFALPGFNTLRREGIELTTGFTATVNAELPLGGLAELITISGAAPVVDTQNVIQRKLYSRDVLDTLPIGKDVGVYATLIPAAVVPSAFQDVGGNRSENQQGFTIHGSRGNDFQQHRDGMFFGQMLAAGNLTKSANASAIQEVTVQTGGGGTAEYESGGAVINMVLKDGGNAFHGTFQGSVGHANLQSDNVDDTLRGRGLTQGYTIKALYDFSVGVGGPIKQDKLWFNAAFQRRVADNYIPGNYFNKRQGTLFYEADLSRPAWEKNYYNDTTIRLTWQAAAKHKIAATYNPEYSCNCYFRVGTGTFAPEAAGDDFYWPNNNAQVAWSYAASNKLLFEAGATLVKALIVRRLTGGTYDDIGVTDLARGYRYGTAAVGFGLVESWGDQLVGQTNQRFAASYVTGTHAFRAGIQTRFGFTDKYSFIPHNLSYTFRGTVPVAATYWAGPYYNKSRQWTVGLFAQDQWTMKRMTLNLGLRYDQLDGWIPALHMPAGPYVPERNFEKVGNVLDWKDLNPRMGVAYDFFGDGRTALKVFLGRYVSFAGNFDPRLINQSPGTLMVQSSTRTWSDANGDYVPQENELGPHSAKDFGQIRSVTQYSDSITHGFGVREYSWQGSASVQHELRPGLAVDVGFFRTWYGNFNVTDNLAISPADFDPYCITTPKDPRLPDGGSQRICGLSDISPTAFGRSAFLVTRAEDYGEQTETFTGVDVTVNGRFGRGAVITGGVSMGKTVTERCFVVDSPQELYHCRVSQPWQAGTQVRLSGTYPLPGKFNASVVWQNLPSIPLTASYVVTNAAVVPELGRSFGACANRTPCTATAVVELIEPNTVYPEGRFNQINFRVTRVFRRNNLRLEPQFDLFNALNANPVLGINGRYGPSWQNALAVLAPRLVKFGVLVSF